MSDVHTARRDVLDPVQRDADVFASRHHGLPQEIIGAQVRQRAAVASDRRS